MSASPGSAVRFSQILDAALEPIAMLKHPFYKRWSAGELSREVLAEYAKQYYAHVKAFPTYVSAVHANTTDLETRQMLLENLIEEERGADNHPALWRRFGAALGVSEREILNAELLPSTVASVETFRRLTRDADPRKGLAALYAYEQQIPAVAKTKREGLAEFYGITDADAVSFFSVHEVADVWHSQSERDVLDATCVSDEDRAAVVAAGEEAARALWTFLDGVEAAYCHSA